MQNLTTKLPPKIVYQQQTFRKRSFIPSAAGVFSLGGAAAARHCSKSGSFANEPWFSKRKNGLWSSPLCFRVGGSMGGGVSSSLRGNFEKHWGILKTVQCPPLWRLLRSIRKHRERLLHQHCGRHGPRHRQKYNKLIMETIIRWAVIGNIYRKPPCKNKTTVLGHILLKKLLGFSGALLLPF